jgi:hypothetical protein
MKLHDNDFNEVEVNVPDLVIDCVAEGLEKIPGFKTHGPVLSGSQSVAFMITDRKPLDEHYTKYKITIEKM